MDKYNITQDSAGTWSVMYSGYYIATFQNAFDANQYLAYLVSGKLINYAAETAVVHD